MARVDVPDAVEGRNDILIEPADPPEGDGAVMTSKGYTANAAVDDDGQRYVGIHAEKAGPLMDRWSEEHGVEYDRETGRIVGYADDVTPDHDSDAATDAESDPDVETTEDTADDADDEEGDDAATCETVKSDGEVCGRELPCAYHSDDEVKDGD